jgi:hypothetical protein
LNPSCTLSRRAGRGKVAPNTYGNSARGVLYGPGMIDFDLSGQEILTCRECLQLRLCAAINPTAPAGIVGRISNTAVDNRDMQASLRLTF